MKPNRKFLRQCKICKSYKQKEELIRLTKDYKTQEIVINQRGANPIEYFTEIIGKLKKYSAQGRSMYICNSEECIKKYAKKNKFI